MNRVTCVVLWALSPLVFSGPVAFANELPSIDDREGLIIERRSPASDEADDDSRPWLGLMVDAGVPDGANVGAAWRPYHWLRFHGGAAYNMVGFGMRGGVSLLPIDEWVTPSLVVEGGHFFGGDLQGFVSSLAGEAPNGVPEDVSYSFGNLHLGLELGSKDFTFYLRGGYSLIDATITPAQPSQGDQVRFDGNAHVSALTPSGKLGFIFYIL